MLQGFRFRRRFYGRAKPVGVNTINQVFSFAAEIPFPRKR
jgi:hypothetical protein